jgi:hypothetical protein
MRALRILRVLFIFQLRKSKYTAPSAILSPLAIAITAMTILPYAISRSYGSIVANSILAGYIPLLAILAALPAAIVVVVEVSIGRYNHLLLSGIPSHLISIPIFFANSLISLVVVILGLALSKIIYDFPSHESISLITLLTFLGTIGVSGLAVAVSYPFRNPQTSGLAVSLLVILFEYLSPVYYPIAAISKSFADIILVLNPLASVMEFIRGSISFSLTLLIIVPSSTLWTILGIILLSKKIEKTI